MAFEERFNIMIPKRVLKSVVKFIPIL